MNVGKGFSVAVRIRLTSGDISYALRELIKANVIISDVEMESELSALISISNKDYKKALKIFKRLGASSELLNQYGFLWIFYKLRKRAVLLAGCMILTILTVWLPTRILFWEVSGNEKLPANYIIEQAQKEGLSFGCKRADIRSEKLKNQLLAQIPQLEWVGVTTSGCVAHIRVSESQPVNTHQKNEAYGNVVAICDGVVNTVTVTKGNPICKPGQVVQKGQVLISGYEDCGLVLKHSGAEGEVYAKTYRVVEGVSLTAGDQRSELRSVSNAFAIRIGKKLIKLSKDSGISYTSCVKMYSERYATLPGGFRLPVSFIMEKQYVYKTNTCVSSDNDFQWLAEAAASYLQSKMLGGTILTGDMKLDVADNICRFRGAYSCTEQIGMNKIEEILSYGKNS